MPQRRAHESAGKSLKTQMLSKEGPEIGNATPTGRKSISLDDCQHVDMLLSIRKRARNESAREDICRRLNQVDIRNDSNGRKI
jgi:hypothetical protein